MGLRLFRRVQGRIVVRTAISLIIYWSVDGGQWWRVVRESLRYRERVAERLCLPHC